MASGSGTEDRVRTRLWAGGAALVVVAVGLGVRSTGSGAVAEYPGDALYTVLVLALVVLLAPRVRAGVAAGTALGFSCAVELFQLSGVPAELAAHSVLARLVFGTSFNAPDLFWYAVGAVFGWAVHRAVRTRKGVDQAFGTVS
ncbi:ribosomal maturation YjgA family protein [Streptomyces bikiniensis]|uniref:ribosomal maturation YjgA family protein n=1 Tax=Streptomyces bikiniensis TaxID=1896 RepID=UPI00068CBBE9